MAVFAFDIDDTLYLRGEAHRYAYYNVIGKIPGVTDEQVLKTTRHWSDVEFDRYGRGEISMEESNILRVQNTFREFGLDVTREKAQQYQDTYTKAQEQTAILPEMKKTLEYLKEKNIPVGILTNGETEHQRFKYHFLHLESLIPEENILASGDIGICKPDPAIFRVFEERMGVSQEDCWFVGDNPESDMEGARAAGWHFIWICQKNLGFGRGDEDMDIYADYVLQGGQGILETVQKIVSRQ